MNIEALSMAVSMSELQNKIGEKLLANSLDMTENLGDGMVKMMEASVTPYLGQNIDIQV